MRRHETDLVSLVAGAVFLAVAAAHVLARANGTDLNLRWTLPALLLLLGALGLVGGLGLRGSREREPAAGRCEGADPAEPDR